MARDTLIGDPPRWLAAARGTWLPWSIAGLSFVLYAVNVALYLLPTRSVQTTSTWASSGLVQLLVFLPFLAFPVVGALIASRHPKNPIGWICLTSGVLWVLAIGLLGVYLPLLFPDGRLPSRRWRLLAWLSGAVILLLSIRIGLAPG